MPAARRLMELRFRMPCGLQLAAIMSVLPTGLMENDRAHGKKALTEVRVFHV
jgi:hypothetical protein